MRGEVHLARRDKHVDLLVPTHRLKGGASPRLQVAVVDQQPRTALHIEPLCKRFDQCSGSGTGLDHRVNGSGTLRFGDRLLERARSRYESEAVVLDSDHPFAPALGGPDELPDRQRIEKFIGEQQHRAIPGDRVERIVEPCTRQRFGLDLPERV